MSSGYGLFYNLASLIGPVLGGACFDAFGYQSTMDYNMIGEAVVFLAFLIFNCGPNVFKNAKQDQKVLDRMKEIELTLAVLEEEGEYNGDLFEKSVKSMDDIIYE